MSQELYWLGATASMTGLFWCVYVLNRFVEIGVIASIGNEGPLSTAKAAWAARAKAAHENAVENLVVFASLVLALRLANRGTALTAAAAMVYFFARLAHFVVYTAGVPAIRTLAFLAGFACQVVIALALFRLI